MSIKQIRNIAIIAHVDRFRPNHSWTGFNMTISFCEPNDAMMFKLMLDTFI